MKRVLAATSLTTVLFSALLAVVPASSAATVPSYRIYQTQWRSSLPVRWNPCTPITYKLNSNGLANAAALSRARRAVAEVSAVSGISFRYVGTTSFVPDSRSAPVPAGVHADLVITWAFPGAGARRSALLRPVMRLAGVGGYGSVSSDEGFRVARTGFVIFDAQRIFRMSARKQYVVALHELGHVLGLDDVHDRRQVMNDVVVPNGPAHLGAGDRLGLRRLGRGAGCLAPAPAPPRPTVQRAGDRLSIVTRQVRSVSGPVAYTLSSPELGRELAKGRTPQFSMPLAVLARVGRAGKTVRFQVRASNQVGAAASQPVAYQVPAVRFTSEPTITVTPSGLDVSAPRAVLAGTDIDISDQLRVTTSGTVEAVKARGGASRTDLVEHIIYSGGGIDRFEVTGTVTVEGAGQSRTFDVSGSYQTAPPPEQSSSTDPPTSAPATPGDAPAAEPSVKPAD